MNVKFTQYLLPHGQQKPIEIEVDEEHGKMAREIVERGLRFEAEVLTTGQVSLTVHDPEIEEDIAIRVVTNGPAVYDAVLAIIDQAYTYERENEENEEDEWEPEWDDDWDDDGDLDFQDPGGRSALRRATPDNPRNLPCPTCGKPNRLTPEDVKKGYQCDECADRAEGIYIGDDY